MGRSPKKGLDYFEKTVNYYEDGRIMDLMDEYGPLGQTIYDIIITLVYKNGYYLDIPMDKLARLIRRTIGTRWVKDINFVRKVIDYCAEIGLFDKDLLQQNIITSAGIQRRYAKVTARNKVDKSNFWLLGNDKSLLSDDKNNFSATENGISATENTISATEIPQDKIRQADMREEINNSCYVTDDEDNDEESEDIEQCIYDSLPIEERLKLKEKCDILIFEKWCRPANRYDYKQAASVMNLLLVKQRKRLICISDDLIKLLAEALEIAADASAPKWSYVFGIFRKWGAAKITSYDDYIGYSLDYSKKQRRR